MLPRPALAVSLFVTGETCVVVGAGGDAVADDREVRLREAGARVVRIEPAAFRAEMLDDAFMVMCSDAGRGPEVSTAARARGVLVWVMDAPDLSDLSMPALARRGHLSLAIATDGVAPALARRLREELQRALDADDGAGAELDAFIAELERVRASLPPGERRDVMRELAIRLRIRIDKV